MDTRNTIVRTTTVRRCGNSHCGNGVAGDLLAIVVDAPRSSVQRNLPPTEKGGPTTFINAVKIKTITQNEFLKRGSRLEKSSLR
ncbi:hypothetical protein RB195_013855 [Necator americanus]|uniref:Uncharacterized protein n=1 Tax=Necator americanus TaxID=51031 RepID=A0ABR1DXN4_NECAM